jgi:hypothetical protein
MKRVVITLFAAISLCSVSAQTAGGGIYANTLEKLRKGYTASLEQ